LLTQARLANAYSPCECSGESSHNLSPTCTSAAFRPRIPATNRHPRFRISLQQYFSVLRLSPSSLPDTHRFRFQLVQDAGVAYVGRRTVQWLTCFTSPPRELVVAEEANPQGVAGPNTLYELRQPWAKTIHSAHVLSR
jgi:hypothetical protein